MKELPKVYDPHAVESKIYDFWEKGGFFRGIRGCPARTMPASPRRSAWKKSCAKMKA